METAYRNSTDNLRILPAIEFRYLNWRYLENIAPGNTGFFLEMMKIFRDNALSHVHKMEELFRNGELPALAQEAHGFKPMGEYLGVEVLGTLSLMVERKALTGKRKEIPSLLFQIKQITDRVMAEIDQMTLGMAA